MPFYIIYTQKALIPPEGDLPDLPDIPVEPDEPGTEVIFINDIHNTSMISNVCEIWYGEWEHENIL